MPNRLAAATSPYLLQHGDNPVDWYEWGPDAFAEARARDVPILLSVGYASCHWCHVMAHESFEDDATARLMNDRFVNVKVDREERPDIDRIYMDAVQAMTGRGGWPMTVFLTPDGEPFHAGTYYPKEDRPGFPSFTRLLDAIADAWHRRRADVDAQAGTLREAIARPLVPPGDAVAPDVLERAHQAIGAAFDPAHGGFGNAPKFPQAPTLEFLLRSAGRPWAEGAEAMLAATLSAMGRGGIRDRLGGGFARYSVDERWLVPHFEKMLYDNALLARVYALGAAITGVAEFADIATSTYEYLLRDLALPGGGFASGEDADSEGVEGRFYVFDHDEVAAAAGDGFEVAAAVMGVTAGGNFEGSNILHEAAPPEQVAAQRGLDPGEVRRIVADTERRLLERRSERVRPALDDKAVCAWNAMAVHSLAAGGTALRNRRLVAAAVEGGEFILDEMRRADGRLVRARRAGRGDVPAFCDDYAATAVALFGLYQATGDDRWYAAAAELTSDMVDLFGDPSDGLFFATGRDAERLIARPKNLFDNPTPSDNALAAEAMQHMAAFTGETAWTDRVDRVIAAASSVLERAPAGAGHLLGVTLVQMTPPLEVAVVGPDPSALLDVARERYRPQVFLAHGASSLVPLLEGREPLGATATAYVCRGFVCDAPTSDPAEFRERLA